MPENFVIVLRNLSLIVSTRLLAIVVFFFFFKYKMVHENAQTSDPKWLNSTFLEKHIQNSFSDRKITLKNFQSKAATAKGENYNSVIYRINVQIIDEPLIPTLANEQVSYSIPSYFSLSTKRYTI